MATIADFLVMQMGVLLTLFVVYFIRDRRAAAQVRREEAQNHALRRPRVRAITVSAANA